MYVKLPEVCGIKVDTNSVRPLNLRPKRFQERQPHRRNDPTAHGLLGGPEEDSKLSLPIQIQLSTMCVPVERPGQNTQASRVRPVDIVPLHRVADAAQCGLRHGSHQVVVPQLVIKYY